MAGATGLDYNAVFLVLNLKHPGREEQLQMFDDLQVMEAAAMEAMRNE